MKVLEASLLAFGFVCLSACDKPPPKPVEYYVANAPERDAMINQCKGMAEAGSDFDCQNAMQGALIAANRKGAGGITFSGKGIHR